MEGWEGEVIGAICVGMAGEGGRWSMSWAGDEQRTKGTGSLMKRREERRGVARLGERSRSGLV